MTPIKISLQNFKQAVAAKTPKAISDSEKKAALAKLEKAQEKFLLECGWRRDGRYWITAEGDRLFLKGALETQLMNLE